MNAIPPVVSPDDWQAALDRLRLREKEATRALDALAAERRRLPMVRFADDHRFEGAAGEVGLAELFEGRRQLVIYHFMPPGESFCVGCSGFVDNIGRLEHLHARGTSLALVTPAPYARLAAYRERMGWQVPWYAAQGGAFNQACGLDGGFGLSVFLREGDAVYRSYFTTARGVDRLRLDFNLLDLTPYGRQERWEDSPAGWPQEEPYRWWRRHDEYAPG
jgi:predicted dithiol-disulfide oxidoreductase (DUF899 family)